MLIPNSGWSNHKMMRKVIRKRGQKREGMHRPIRKLQKIVGRDAGL